MKLHIHFPLFAISLLLASTLKAQENVDATAIKVFNFTSFIDKPTRNGTDELLQLVDPKYATHPEFGILPYDAPCKDCIELINRRTSNTRFYVKKGTHGQKFYSQASVTDLHYVNQKGEWITIDPHMVPQEGSKGVYVSGPQPDQTTLNMEEGYTSIQLMDKTEFKFNQSLVCYATDDFTSYDNIQFINRNNYTAGFDGALVHNAFGNIDQQLIFDEARVKSNYILPDLSSVNTTKKYFVIEDAFTLPDGYHLKYDEFEGNINASGFWYGDLILENSSGIEMARVDAPIIYDSNPADSVFLPDKKNLIAYQMEQDGNNCKLKMIVSNAYLTSPDRVFPITIDPTVFGTTATWTGVSGTDDSPTFCTVSLSVPTPAMATLTGSSVYWEFVASGVACGPFCKLKYMQVRIGTSCGYSPSAAGVWVCPLCNTAGTWLPVVDDATTAALVSCNSPQCSSYNINFTLYHNQYQCATAGGCVTTCDFMQKFQVTIEGETVAATAMVEGGTTTYTVVNCADQSGWLSTGTPIYGVPGYTYSWTPIGATTSSVYVTYPLGTTNYTLTITDACGNTSTDVITVINNCVALPINLVNFNGHAAGEVNILNWSVANNIQDGDFIIQRSSTGIEFEDIGTVKQMQDSNQTEYMFTDDHPRAGINYYRLKQIDDNATANFSDMISIHSTIKNDFEIIVNTQNTENNNIELTILSPESGPSDLNIYDVTGKTVFTEHIQLNEGNNSTVINSENLAKGTYVIGLKLSSSIQAETKFIK